MRFTDFFISVVLVSFSGALAPGPLFFANITAGLNSGAKSGLFFSIGHSIVELPLILLLSMGLLTASNEPFIKPLIGIVGGVTLLGFGLLQLKNLNKLEAEISIRNIIFKDPLVLGMALSALNPFFILWWFTVGAVLIYDSLALASLLGFLLLFICHVWIDYAWLISTAYLARRGRLLLKSRYYKLIVGIFGVVMIYYGINFITSSLS